jgi:predicted enzyme related to lactoylglutathione lyase
MVFKKEAFILIWSGNPDKLKDFYNDVLELEQTDKLELPDDYGYEFKIAETSHLWIGLHSEIKGKNKDPKRIMHNLYTDEVEKWYNKVKDAGCEILAEPFLAPFSTKEKGIYVSTFLDPEGNCWQFMGKLK